MFFRKHSQTLDICTIIAQMHKRIIPKMRLIGQDDETTQYHSIEKMIYGGIMNTNEHNIEVFFMFSLVRRRNGWPYPEEDSSITTQDNNDTC